MDGYGKLLRINDYSIIQEANMDGQSHLFQISSQLLQPRKHNTPRFKFHFSGFLVLGRGVHIESARIDFALAIGPSLYLSASSFVLGDVERVWRCLFTVL